MSTTEWDLTQRVASRFAGSYPLAGTYHEERYAEQAPEFVARAAELVTAETGLSAAGQPTVDVVSRQQWVDVNIEAFERLLEPVARRLAKRSSSGAPLRVMGAEIGVLLGLVSRRVLGQYELVLPTADGTYGDTVMFVGANVLAMERAHEFRPKDFRFWVALHECTHRAQFLGVPWLRDYFFSLVEELVSRSEPSGSQVQRVTAAMRAASESGTPVLDDTGVLGLLASDEQRVTIDRVQALMCLLEGHGHMVMDRIAARTIVSQQRMSNVLAARRSNPRVAALLRFIGIEMKLKQYSLGAAFIGHVERRAGWDQLTTAFESPQTLPTLDEINDPESWLARIG
ncbi:MAG: zinc-dependent metalloprotease [Pirellulales bacterium]